MASLHSARQAEDTLLAVLFLAVLFVVACKACPCFLGRRRSILVVPEVAGLAAVILRRREGQAATTSGNVTFAVAQRYVTFAVAQRPRVSAREGNRPE